jgi:RimJ/RimL family protein N-acetyltransferase
MSSWAGSTSGPVLVVTSPNVELGYRLRRAAWGHGYATEGSRTLISMGFTDLGVQRVYAHTMTANTASRHVL